MDLLTVYMPPIIQDEFKSDEKHYLIPDLNLCHQEKIVDYNLQLK